jgi:hypothetical protein
MHRVLHQNGELDVSWNLWLMTEHSLSKYRYECEMWHEVKYESFINKLK